ncbi:MAG: histidine phosphatase family protein [Anaerovoracaceae bacterium]|jgi:broad specificity phosphatase PhoE
MAGEKTTTIYMVRHGATEWNEIKRFQGMTDIPLNERGRRQASYARDALKDAGITVCFSSPLLRAHETAEIICRPLGVPVQDVEGFHEHHLGEWEGLTAEEIDRRFPGSIAVWRGHPKDVRIAGGETFQQVRERGTRAFWDVVRKNRGETILIVSHMVCLCSILTGLAGIDLNDIWKRPIGNAAWCRVRIDENDQAEILEWDHEDHIPPEERRKPKFLPKEGETITA